MTVKMLLALSLWLFSALWIGNGSACASASPEADVGSTIALAHGGEIPVSGTDWTITKVILPGYTIRHEAPEVRLQFSVSDERGHLLSNLTGQDLRIMDNHRTVQHVRDFSRSDDLPIQLGLLLDVSDSVQKRQPRQRQAAQFVIAHLLRSESDRAFLADFSRGLTVRQDYTGDQDALRQAVSRTEKEGYTTYLYDTLYHICLDKFSPDPSTDGTQRVLLLISDGEDTGSVHSLEEAILIAQRRGIGVYTLSLHSRHTASAGDRILQRLADATGGLFYVASTEKDFPGLCAAMEQQMRTQFAVSFQPAELTSGFHAVQIELLRDPKARVHARPGYFVAAQ